MLKGMDVASDEIDPEDMEELEFEEELEEPEVDPENLEEDFEEEFDEDDDVLVDDDSDAATTEAAGSPAARKAGEDDEDDDDMVAADDVEEDLDKILKDKLTAEDAVPEDEEEAEVDDRSSGEDRLQPKRADEVLCSRCFLLVRDSAPACPVGDDGCPVFSA